ncbi:MAG: hypothetical protein BGO30_07750 [Bacteroidetes bacterium 41-46]|nr:MAG: hypothetical protein BGO30_07750 [Bacteroidetes bacterium 41-46]
MGIAKGLVGNTVCTAFDELLDTRYSKYILSREFNNGKLFCSMTSSVARDSLSLLKGSLIDKINDKIGEVVLKDIVLK